MSACVTVPPILTLAEKASLFSRPQERLTIRLPTVTSAMRSAASTASLIARSASSRSTTMPDLMPRERVEAKPSTSIACVRRRSASPSRGFSRAIRQQTLVEPTSSTLTVADLREPSGLMRDTPAARCS